MQGKSITEDAFRNHIWKSTRSLPQYFIDQTQSREPTVGGAVQSRAQEGTEKQYSKRITVSAPRNLTQRLENYEPVMRHKGVDSFPRIYVVNEWMRTITKLNQLCKSVLQILQSHSVLFFTRSFFASSSLSTAIASVIYILILRTPESKDFSKISSYFHLQFPP